MKDLGFPTLAPIPNQDRATRPMGGESLPAPLDLLQRATPQRNESPLSQLTPFQRRDRYDGV